MHNPKEVVQEFMTAFISAWPEQDAAKLGRFFAADADYHNIPLDPVHGREAIEATLAGFMEMGGRVEVEVSRIVSEGPFVVVERVDRFVGPRQTISLPMMGIFEVRDGVIVAWRDYFDLTQFRSQLAGEPGQNDAGA